MMPRRTQYETYVAFIEKCSFGAMPSISTQVTALRLRGWFLYPRERLLNAAVVITVLGSYGPQQHPKGAESDLSDGMVRKEREGWRICATAPADTLPHLAEACALGRLNLAVATGSGLFRNAAVLHRIGLHNRAEFDAHRGDPLRRAPEASES